MNERTCPVDPDAKQCPLGFARMPSASTCRLCAADPAVRDQLRRAGKQLHGQGVRAPRPPLPPCTSPPNVVRVTVTGATDPDCIGTWDLPWAGSEYSCEWWAASTPVTAWNADRWTINFGAVLNCDCAAAVEVVTADCHTGGSADGCGGTITVAIL